MRSHIFALPATTTISVKAFVFKRLVVRKGLPKVAVTGLGAGGPRFKSGRPDHSNLSYFSAIRYERIRNDNAQIQPF
jgi:hypothetical protein